MHFLADENFPKRAVIFLRRSGHHVSWAREEFPGWTDTELLEVAERSGSIFLTLDKDFIQLAQQRPKALRRSGVIVFRVHPATAENIIAALQILDGTVEQWTGHATLIGSTGLTKRIPLIDKSQA